MKEMPNYKKRSLADIIPTASFEAIEIIEKMLSYNPEDRPTADDLMKEPYFSEINEHYFEIEK
jgi:protein kinase